LFSWISRAYNWALGKVETTTAGWVRDIISTLYGWLHSLFGLVISGWDTFYNRVVQYARDFESFCSEVGAGFRYLWHVWWTDFQKYLKKYVLDPIEAAAKWIGNEGAKVWYYIDHPDKLVALIWDDLLTQIENEGDKAAEKLGTFFGKLILKNIKWLLTIVEDIVNAVF
jgi:hypothetical protein